METLKALKELNPNAVLYFIVGSDAIPEFETWKNIDEILSLCVFLIGMRPGFKKMHISNKMIYLKGIFPDVSSTQIREILSRGESAKKFIPAEVYDFIIKRKLYQ